MPEKDFEYAFSSHIDTNLTVSVLKMTVRRQKPQNNLIFLATAVFSMPPQVIAKHWLSTTLHKVCQERVILVIMQYRNFFQLP